MLLLLDAAPSHGYDLRNGLNAMGLRVDAGALYRGLRALEEDALVRAEWEPSSTGPARRVYEITPDGRRRLDAYAKDYAERRRLLSRFLREYRSSPR